MDQSAKAKIARKAEKASVSLDGKRFLTPIYDRERLPSGKNYRGPAIVTEYSATTVVPHTAKFQVDSAGNLIISL